MCRLEEEKPESKLKDFIDMLKISNSKNIQIDEKVY